MPATLKTEGTWATLTADGTVTIPGSPSDGDRMFLFAHHRNHDITIADPSGWTIIGSLYHPSPPTATTTPGTGSVTVEVWYRDWVTGDANPTLDFSTDTNLLCGAVIMLWEKASNETWDTPLTVVGDWGISIAQTISATSTVAVPNGSVVMGHIAFRDDATIVQVTGIDVASGITWNGAHVKSPATDHNTTTGNDGSGTLGHRFVTTGGTVTLRNEALLLASETGTLRWVVQGVTEVAATKSRYRNQGFVAGQHKRNLSQKFHAGQRK